MTEVSPKRGFSFHFQSPELDELREVIGRNIRPCEFTPLRRLRYEGRLRHNQLGAVGFSVVSVGPELDVNVDPVEDSYLIQCPLAGSFGANCLERERLYHVGDLHVVNPAAPLHVAMHPGAQVLLIRIDKATLEEHARVLGDTAEVDTRRLLPEALPVGGWKGASLRRYVRFLHAESMSPESVLHNKTTSRAAEQTLLSLFLSLANSEARPGRNLQKLRRAEEYIDGHADQDIALVDIVRAAGVDAPTLEFGFLQRRGTDPLSWLEERRGERAANEPALTARELEIARLVAAGLNNLEIAQCLTISRNTVKEALKRIFRKLDVDSRAELVTRLAEAGLLKL
jgi:DNA-binding CsgD family transcriptional regulator